MFGPVGCLGLRAPAAATGERVVLAYRATYAQAVSERAVPCLPVRRDRTVMRDGWHSAGAPLPAVEILVSRTRASSPKYLDQTTELKFAKGSNRIHTRAHKIQTFKEGRPTLSELGHTLLHS